MIKTKQHNGKIILGVMIMSVLFKSIRYFAHPEVLRTNIKDINVGVQVKEPDALTFADDDDHNVFSENDKNTSTRSYAQRMDWWKDYVEETSVIFQPSNNTDWCAEGRGYSGSNRRSLNVRFKRTKRIDVGRSTGKERTRSNLHGFQSPLNPTKIEKKKENFLPKTGLYLVKTIKAGSSTAAGVSLQIAEAVAAKKGLAESCPHHVHHGIAYLDRKEPYFMWTVVREPAKRAISNYFFADVSRRERPFNSTILISQMHKQHRNFQLRYIGLQPRTKTTLYNPKTATNQQVIEMVQDIIRSYNFIAVTERMDESLVVMKLLYNIPDEAMVVLSSKRAGGFDDGNYNERCYKIQSSHTTPDVDEYVSTRFHLGNWDYYLYEAVNRSLDRTIDMLGRDRVEREVARHKKLEKLAEEKCYDTAVFPCTKEGVRPNTRSQESCYFGDVGCGHDCVQRVIRDYVNSTP